MLEEEFGIDFQIVPKLFWHIAVEIDGIDRTNEEALFAGDTDIRIDVIHGRVGRRVDASDRTDVNAGCVLDADTCLRDYIGRHSPGSPYLAYTRDCAALASGAKGRSVQITCATWT